MPNRTSFDFIERFADTRILVVGEVGIDEYLWGECRRISPEAPVPVVEVDSRTFKLGLSGNVAQNIASLGGKVSLLSVCGEDADAGQLREMLDHAGVTDSEFVVDPSRPTLRKVRVLAQKQHVVRVDYEKSHKLSLELAAELTKKIENRLDGVQGVIVQDYGKGIWNADTMSFVKKARDKKIPVFVDPNRQTALSLYQGVTLLTPNLLEAETLCRFPNEPARLAGKNNERLAQMANEILKTTHSEHAVITCGEFGMVSLTAGQTELSRIPTFAREVFDVTGAGDTVVAVIAMMYAMGNPLPLCLRVANAAAGIVVGQIGASVVTPAELRQELVRVHALGLLNG